MTDKSEGPTNPYGHEDCDDISGCGDKCKISAWDNGYAAGFKAGLERKPKKPTERKDIIVGCPGQKNLDEWGRVIQICRACGRVDDSKNDGHEPGFYSSED